MTGGQPVPTPTQETAAARLRAMHHGPRPTDPGRQADYLAAMRAAAGPVREIAGR
jgi:hypothetical protein